jgi:hypothetical protein
MKTFTTPQVGDDIDCLKSFDIASGTVNQCFTAISNNIKLSNNFKQLLNKAHNAEVA